MKKVVLTICGIGILSLLTILIAKYAVTNHKQDSNYNKTDSNAVSDYVICDEGYELYNNSCRKLLETKPANENFSCDNGYTLNKKNNNCEKIEKIDANTFFSCSDGYSLDNNKCSGITSINANKSYDCKTIGGTLNGDKCNQTVADTKALYCEKYICAIGSYDASIDKCVSYSPYANIPSYHNKICAQYTCLRGTFKNSMCYLEVSTNANITYSCDEGYTLQNNKCIKNITIEPKINYSCPSGYTLKNQKCEHIITIKPNINYECENNGVLNDTSCNYYEIKEVSKK